MQDLLSWIDCHTQELVDTYKHLHSIPELGFEEVKTAAFLADGLRKAGYEVQEQVGGKTGVIGTLKGSEPGPVFALRADMDALPMEEQTGLDYSSTHPGVMHSCGHDSHSAMLLFAARAIAETGGIKRGTLKIVFQPAEETLVGARSIISSGAIDDVEEIVGMHVRNSREAKVGEAAVAICHGACWHIHAKIHGKAAHAAWWHKGVNVIEAVAAIINATNAIHCDPTIGHSAKVTRCYAEGTASNIIPEFAELVFDLRAQTNEVMSELVEKVKRAIETGAASVGATAEITIGDTVPAADFDPGLIEDVRKSIIAVLGEDKTLGPVISPGSEDFHCFSVEAGKKTAFVGVGADMTTGGHTSTMCLDLSALPTGAKIYAHIAATKLR